MATDGVEAVILAVEKVLSGRPLSNCRGLDGNGGPLSRHIFWQKRRDEWAQLGEMMSHDDSER